MSKFYQDLAGQHYEVLEKAIYRKDPGQITDPMDLYLPLMALPRSLLSWLIKNVQPMKVGSSEAFKVPGSDCILKTSKISEDLYQGEIQKGPRVIHRFEPTILPALGGHLLSVCELYDEVAGRPVEEIEKREMAEQAKESSELRALIDKVGSLIDKITESNMKKEEISASPVSPIPSPAPTPVIVNVTLSNVGSIGTQPIPAPKNDPTLIAEEVKKEEIPVANEAKTVSVEPVTKPENFNYTLLKPKATDKKRHARQYFRDMLASRVRPDLSKEEIAKANKPAFDKPQKAMPMQPQAPMKPVEPIKGNATAPTLNAPKNTAIPNFKPVSMPGTAGIKAPIQPKQPKMPIAQKQMQSAVRSVSKEELDSAKSDDGKPMFKEEAGEYKFNPTGVHAVMTKNSVIVKKNDDASYNILVNNNEWDYENLLLLTQMIKLKDLMKKIGF